MVPIHDLTPAQAGVVWVGWGWFVGETKRMEMVRAKLPRCEAILLRVKTSGEMTKRETTRGKRLGAKA